MFLGRHSQEKASIFSKKRHLKGLLSITFGGGEGGRGKKKKELSVLDEH